MAAKFYAWSDLYYGGDVEDITLPTGGTRRVVSKRNVIRRGESVTRTKLNLSEAEFDTLVESGSVRAYPVPDEANEYVSPHQAVLRRLYTDGDIDPDTLLAMAPSSPSAADDGAEEKPVGA